MIPIHELLSRIRYDREFGQGRFEIGYVDRFEGTIERVAFQEIAFPAGERHVFEVTAEIGEHRKIPLHRIREVYRDGHIIWRRPPARTT